VPATTGGTARLAIDSLGTQSTRGTTRPITDVAAVDVLAQLRHASVIRFGAATEHRRIIEDPRFAQAKIPVVVLHMPRELGLAALPSLIEAGYSVATASGPCIWGWRQDGMTQVNGHAGG
jgi:hypothetical protein